MYVPAARGTVVTMPDGSTRLDLRMTYKPPAGALGHAVAVVDPARAAVIAPLRPDASVDEIVVRHASCPIVLVGPHCPDPDALTGNPRLLVCTDGSVHSEAVVPAAPEAPQVALPGFALMKASTSAVLTPSGQRTAVTQLAA